MTLKEFYDKIPSSKHSDIKVFPDKVIYDDGVNIFIAYLKQERGDIILVPADKAGKAALKAIKGT